MYASLFPVTFKGMCLFLVILLFGDLPWNEAFKPLRNTIKDATEEPYDTVIDANNRMIHVKHSTVINEQKNALKTPFGVYFGLYTSKNSETGQHLYDGNVESIRESNFDSEKPTRVVCHGWESSNQSDISTLIRDGYLNRGDFNVIIVDWSEAAKDINYVKSAVSTRPAAKKVASFLTFLIRNANLDPNNTYLIGHSLGAHVVGMAGRRVKPMINTIFGLDPAKPLFGYFLQKKRIAKSDALYVETIHTNGGVFGFERPIGNSSFYPNFGNAQPGCNGTTNICAHNRSYMYFAESLNDPNQFVAKKCKNFKSLLVRQCDGTGMKALMGGEPSNYGRGVKGEFYLPVNSGYPFAKGDVF